MLLKFYIHNIAQLQDEVAGESVSFFFLVSTFLFDNEFWGATALVSSDFFGQLKLLLWLGTGAAADGKVTVSLSFLYSPFRSDSFWLSCFSSVVSLSNSSLLMSGVTVF